MTTAYAWGHELDEDGEIIEAEIVEDDESPAIPLRVQPEPTRVAVREPRASRFVPPVRLSGNPATTSKRVVWRLGTFALVTFPGDCLKGFHTWVRGWWRWMMLATETERVERDGKFSINAKDRRKDRQKYFKISLVCAFLLTVSVSAFVAFAPREYQLAAALMLILGLFSTGHQWSRPREATFGDAREMGWAGSMDALRNALVNARVIGEFDEIFPVGFPVPVGGGYLAVFDLPGPATVDDVRAKRAAIASSLAVNSEFMTIEKGEHDARVKLWITSEDPFKGGPKRLPLLDCDSWNAWQPAPFGETVRGQQIPLRLVYSNYLGGGKPAAGKSFSARVVVAPYVLDPATRIFCANGKGDGAWDALSQISTEFICGRRDEDAWRLNSMLDRIREEMDDRMANRDKMSGSQIKETDALPLWLVVIDELQNYTTSGVPSEEKVYNKKASLGELIAFKLTDLVKNGRSAGIILVLLTQKPDDKSLPSALRDQIGTRFSNKVMTWQTSNMILGSNLSKLGYDASQLPSRYRGLGILVPDMEENVLDDAIGDFPTVRPYFVSDVDWAELGARGRELREEAGTLEGHAAGESMEPEPCPVPDLLESIFDFVDDLDDGQRVSSVELRERFAPEMTQTAFGLQLGKWGCPSDRDGARGAKGPRVGEIRAVVQRIRGGGQVEKVRAA